WLDVAGELARLRELTDLPVRSTGRLPGQPSPYGTADAYLFAPATATSIAKLALGIADNQALTQLCEAVGTPGVPVVLHPQAGAAPRNHPAYAGHVATLRAAGVHVSDEDPAQPWEPLLSEVAGLVP